KKNNFTNRQISVMWHKDHGDDSPADTKMTKGIGKEVTIGAAVGSIVGALTGVGLFAIPGLGFLYGAGAILGAIAGLDFGLLGGGIAGVIGALAIPGIKDDHHQKYDSHLQKGHYLLIVQGSETEAKQANDLLYSLGHHTEINVH